MATRKKKARVVKKGTKVKGKTSKPFDSLSLAERLERIKRRTSKITGKKKKK